MGMGTTALILTIVLAFSIYLAVPTHPKPILFSFISGDYFTLLDNSFFLFLVGSISLVFIVGAGSVAVGLFSFPNPYLIFAGISGVLLAFATFPIELVTSAPIPIEIRALVCSIFGVLYLLAVLSWYKGTGEF